MSKELDSYLVAIHLLFNEDPNFHKAALSNKNTTFLSVFSKNKNLELLKANPTLPKFLIAFCKSLTQALYAPLDPYQFPLEAFIRKFLVIREFKLETNAESALQVQTLHFETTKDSALLECLGFLNLILKEPSKPGDIWKLVPDLMENIISNIKLFAELQVPYLIGPSCKTQVAKIKDALYKTLETVICEETLYAIKDAAAKNTLKSFFSLFEVAEDINHFKDTGKILKYIGQMLNKSSEFAVITDSLQKNKYLLKVWKYPSTLRQTNNFTQKHQYLEVLKECFQFLSTFTLNFLTNDILQEVSSFFLRSQKLITNVDPRLS